MRIEISTSIARAAHNDYVTTSGPEHDDAGDKSHHHVLRGHGSRRVAQVGSALEPFPSPYGPFLCGVHGPGSEPGKP